MYWGFQFQRHKGLSWWADLAQVARQGHIEIPSLAQAGSREQTQWAETITIHGLPSGTDVIYHIPISRCSTSSPGSFTNWDQLFKYLNLWETFSLKAAQRPIQGVAFHIVWRHSGYSRNNSSNYLISREEYI